MGHKILIVDDEPDLEILINEKFRKKIKNKEYEFIYARNGREALEILNKSPELELIFTDINMPEMDGLTLLGKLKSLNRIHIAVVISAYGDMSNIRSAMNKGAADFITKPIDFDDLEATMKKIIEQLQHRKDAMQAQKSLYELETELIVARTIQQSMMPRMHPIPKDLNYFINGKMIPAKQVGGDFFDFFRIGDNKIGIIIADVSGKNISASLYMAVSKTLIRYIANEPNQNPAETFTKVNQLLSIENESCMFVTAFYGIFNPDNGELVYSNAGHPPPFLITKEGQVSKLGTQTRLPLGVNLLDDLPYLSETKILNKGDSLILYTDGITEAFNSENELYTDKRLEAVLSINKEKNLHEIFECILSDVRQFAQGTEQADDITLLGLSFTQNSSIVDLQIPLSNVVQTHEVSKKG